MPYFCNDDINILFIHIPKTGGSSVELYFADRFKIPLDNKSLYFHLDKSYIIPEDFNKKISLQHQTYRTLYKYRDEFKIKFNDKLNIYTNVRNPYDRIMSDLFWFKLINRKSTQKEVYNVINKFILSEPHIYDNHNIPQYKYLIDEDEKIINNIIILKTESLNNDMIQKGFNNFNIYALKNKNNLNYDDYLNDDSIKLINIYYEKDFKYFSYTMKN